MRSLVQSAGYGVAPSLVALCGMRFSAAATLLLALALISCTSDDPPDAAVPTDASHDALTAPRDGATLDAAQPDAAGDDAGSSLDAGAPRRTFVYVGLSNGNLLTLDGRTLAELSRTDTGNFPEFVTATADGAHLYAVQGSDNEVIALSVATDGTTRVVSRQAAPGGPTHLSIDHEARFVFTASYGSGEIGVYPIAADGTLGARVFTEVAGRNAHAIVVDALAEHVYVPCLGIDRVVGYTLDTRTGQLTRVGESAGNGDGPRHMALSPSGSRAYVVDELSSEIDVFDVLGTGRLTRLSTVPTLPASFTGGNTGAEILITRDGRHVYSSNRGHDSVAVFATTADSLTLVEHEPTDGGHPRSMGLSVDERRLYVANRDSENIAIFDVDTDSGALTYVRTLSVDAQPYFVGDFVAP